MLELNRLTFRHRGSVRGIGIDVYYRRFTAGRPRGMSEF